MVIVEGLCPHCWLCKQLGHIARDYPQKKGESPPKKPIEKPKGVSMSEPGDKKEGWTEAVKKRKRKSSETTQNSTSPTPDKSPVKLTTQDPVNKKAPIEVTCAGAPNKRRDSTE